MRACRTDGNGQPVPTLDEVLDYLAPLDVDIAPEVKAYGTDMDDDEVAALVTAVKDRKLAARTFVQSFQPGVFALGERRRAGPDDRLPVELRHSRQRAEASTAPTSPR